MRGASVTLQTRASELIHPLQVLVHGELQAQPLSDDPSFVAHWNSHPIQGNGRQVLDPEDHIVPLVRATRDGADLPGRTGPLDRKGARRHPPQFVARTDVLSMYACRKAPLRNPGRCGYASSLDGGRHGRILSVRLAAKDQTDGSELDEGLHEQLDPKRTVKSKELITTKPSNPLASTWSKLCPCCTARINTGAPGMTSWMTRPSLAAWTVSGRS